MTANRTQFAIRQMAQSGRWARETTRAFLLAFLLALGMPLTAQGTVIYDNGPPDQAFGTQMSEFMVAEDFITMDANVVNIRFWTLQSAASDYSGSVSWAIFSGVSAPGALVQGGTAAVAETPTGLSSGFGYAEYVIDIPVAVTLSAGSYWLGLNNAPLDTSGNASQMLWSTTANSIGSEGLYLDPNFGWVGTGLEHAFRLDAGPVTDPGRVPEPSSLALLLGGLVPAVFRRRISSKQTTTV